jgi:hypothetical protein
MSSTPKVHDNIRVMSMLQPFVTTGELCRTHPAAEDIFSGSLELKTAGDTSTRSLSRRTLFHILQHCPTISVASIASATLGRYAYCTLASYAAAARVASKALAKYIDRLSSTKMPTPTLMQERQALDAPYDVELRALGLL